MNKSTARLLAITIGIAAASVVAGGAAELGGERRLPQLSRMLGFGDTRQTVSLWGSEFQMRVGAEVQARVLVELAGLEGHPWAGDFSSADQRRLVIAPATGFSLHEPHVCGVYEPWLAAGKVTVTGPGQVHLELEQGCERPLPVEREWRWWCRDEILHFIEWGDLQFAVPASSLVRFYAQVNDGHSFPHHPLRQLVPREDFDLGSPERPSGWPRIVPGFEHMLLEQPVQARVVSLLELRDPQVGTYGRSYRTALYGIDAGSAHGLAAGMHMYLEGETELNGSSVLLEHVGEHSARVLLGWIEGGEDRARLVVGSPLSTLHPEARRR